MRFTVVTLAAAALLLAVSPALAKHGEGESDDDDPPAPATAPSTAPSTFSPQAASSSSPSSSASASPSAGPPPFQFIQPANGTTCAPATLRWHAAAALGTTSMTLTVTNDRAATGPLASPASTSAPALVSRTLTTDVAAAAQAFTWPQVDVPPGTYVAVARDTAGARGVLVQSPPFLVSGGADTGCVLAVNGTGVVSDSHSPGGSGSGSGSDTDDDDSGSGSDSDSDSGSSSQASGSGPTPTGTGAAASDSTTAVAEPKKLSPAVLGGVVAGVAVGVVMLILVFTFPHYWKARLERRARNRRPGGPYYLF
ncbi:hypothetical protein C8Q80DRAFT_1353588 [Daedaleopsis nitida]|nr:hypothetical protein C8Q80DRAFT_1353588 [Daedaleopsis nitida]